MIIRVLQTAVDYIQAHPTRFGDALQQHLWLCSAALGTAIVLALPLGILISRRTKLKPWILPVFSGLRVVPSLAILALMIPILGTGLLPALLALILLAVPPILINTTLGLSQVNPDTEEAARGCGLTDTEIFSRITFPLALPSIITGLRTATVEVIASATLAALIGGGGLGIFIINGLSLYNFGLLLVGTLPVAILALIAELAFSRLEQTMTRYRTC